MTNSNRAKTFLILSAVLALISIQPARTLNDFAYTQFFQSAGTHNPTDATTVYFGGLASAPVTTASVYRRQVPRAGSVRRVQVHVLVLGTLGSGETGEIYLRVNNTDDYRIDNGFAGQPSIDWNAAVDLWVVEFGDAGPYVIPTDFWEIKVVYPTWPITNPTIVAYYGDIFIEP